MRHLLEVVAVPVLTACQPSRKSAATTADCSADTAAKPDSSAAQRDTTKR